MPSSSQPSMPRRRTFAPVARSALSNSISSFVDSVTTRSPGSSFMTLVRVISSMSCSRHHSSGRRSEEHTSELQSHSDLHSFPTRRSSDLLLRRQRDHPLARIELHDARARHQLDVLLAPPLIRAEEHLLPRLLSLQVSLRQRRSVVGRIGFATHEENRAVRSLLPEPAGTVRRREAAPDQQEVDRSASHALYAAAERFVNRSVTRDSMPTSSTSRTSSPACMTESPAGTNPPPPRRIEITREPSGNPRSLTVRPAASEPSATSSSMISSRSSGRSSRCTRPYFGTSCSISRRMRSVAEITGFTPSSSKCWRLRGLLHRATTLVTPYFSRATCEIRMLSSSSPVTATTRSARSIPARSSTHSSEPSPYRALCSSSCSTTL